MPIDNGRFLLYITNMIDQTENPFIYGNLFSHYDYWDVMQLTTPEQFSVIGHFTRTRLLGLLSQRAATTKQLAETHHAQGVRATTSRCWKQPG